MGRIKIVILIIKCKKNKSVIALGITLIKNQNRNVTRMCLKNVGKGAQKMTPHA